MQHLHKMLVYIIIVTSALSPPLGSPFLEDLGTLILPCSHIYCP